MRILILLIMEAMKRLMSGRTTIMIAHRLATLDGCHLRLQIERGRVHAEARFGDQRFGLAPRVRGRVLLQLHDILDRGIEFHDAILAALT